MITTKRILPKFDSTLADSVWYLSTSSANVWEYRWQWCGQKAIQKSMLQVGGEERCREGTYAFAGAVLGLNEFSISGWETKIA
ncbi:unnamed protein product [Toxocara canis]|uniref:Uncharacterized protein n=1 Tax=Toxocara canis TaxID=6265 RepID=A0A183UW13_TOXCA|nr:unnamed protein product [Toxocara canis]